MVHITEEGRRRLLQNTEVVSERPSRESLKLHGQIPERTNLHGRRSEIESIKESLERKMAVHLRGMPGIGKSTLARTIVQELAQRGAHIYWAALDSYCDVHEAIQRMEFQTPSILDVEGYASLFEQDDVVLVFDDVHSISPRHQSSFLNLFQSLQNRNIPFMMIGRDRETFSIDGAIVDLGPLEQSEAIELLSPELGEERASIVETLGGHLLRFCYTMPRLHFQRRIKTFGLMLSRLSLVTPQEKYIMQCHHSLSCRSQSLAERMPEPDDVTLLDEHTLLRWGAQDSIMEMQHLIRNVCKSSLAESEIDALHQSAIHIGKKSRILLRIYSNCITGFKGVNPMFPTIYPSEETN